MTKAGEFMANSSAVFREISEMLESDVESRLTLQQRDRLLLAAMSDLHKEIVSMDQRFEKLFELDKRVARLEEKSIVLWAEKHPKLALTLLAVFLALLNMWFVSDFRKAILAALGLPTELAP